LVFALTVSVFCALVVLHSLGNEGFKTEDDILPPNKTEAHVQTSKSVVTLLRSTGQAAATTMTEAGKTLEGSEAEIVLLPLRLAFETKQAKIIEPALDCLHVSAPDPATNPVLSCSPSYFL